MKLLSLHDVSVSYDGTKNALNNVSFDIYSDDFIGIIGPNGGGKTTLVKAIIGTVSHTGIIEFADGIGVDNGTIGYLPQQDNFDKSFPITVQEVIFSGLLSRRIYLRIGRNEKEKAAALMELTGITTIADKPIGEVSGGEMQKALLCRALISNPRLLILDEPANFVDARFEKELYDILKRLSTQMAIIMVSHDIGSLMEYVNSIVCVNRTAHRYPTHDLTATLLADYGLTHYK